MLSAELKNNTQIIKQPSKPLYTLFIPFTRTWFVDVMLAQITILAIPRQDFEIVFYNDSALPVLQTKLSKWMYEYSPLFNGMTLYTSGNAPLGENDLVRRRRDRIVDMKRNSVGLISSTRYVLGLEDDCLVPTNAFTVLLDHFTSTSNLAVASGVQMGRWETPMIGAWEITPVNEPTVMSTIDFQQDVVREVQGLGWYCYVTPSELYRSANYRYDAECFGPDVCFTWDLCKQGYKAIVDMRLVCPHITQYGTFIPTEKNVRTAVWDKVADLWVRREDGRASSLIQ